MIHDPSVRRSKMGRISPKYANADSIPPPPAVVGPFLSHSDTCQLLSASTIPPHPSTSHFTRHTVPTLWRHSAIDNHGNMRPVTSKFLIQDGPCKEHGGDDGDEKRRGYSLMDHMDHPSPAPARKPPRSSSQLSSFPGVCPPSGLALWQPIGTFCMRLYDFQDIPVYLDKRSKTIIQ